MDEKSLLDNTGVLDDLSGLVNKTKLVNRAMEIVGSLSTMSAPVRWFGDNIRCWFCLREIDLESIPEMHSPQCPWRRAIELVEEIRIELGS